MLSLSEIVGGGYADFWRSRHRYRLVKGSRASKKSKTAALNFIVRLMTMPGVNLLCLRNTAATLRDSVYADLCWAVNRLGAAGEWEMLRGEPRMRFKSNGNEVLFRGLDDPLKLSSLTVSSGSLCFVWLEEAFELKSVRDFEKLELLLRGPAPDGAFKQFTLTFNPWLRGHWLFEFFNREDPEVFAMTSTYLQNEFLDEQDRALFDRIRAEQPERYLVEGLGEWGVSGELVFNNLKIGSFSQKGFDNWREGLDWGFSTDPLAWIACHYDKRKRVLYICDEIYSRGLLGVEAAREIRARTRGAVIIADSSEPRSIAEMRALGLRIRGAKKGPGSVESGIKRLQGLSAIIIDPGCVSAAREFSELHYQSGRAGDTIPKIAAGPDHLVDAARYALEDDMPDRPGALSVKKTRPSF